MLTNLKKFNANLFRLSGLTKTVKFSGFFPRNSHNKLSARYLQARAIGGLDFNRAEERT
jgi:hypothetical protein